MQDFLISHLLFLLSLGLTLFLPGYIACRYFFARSVFTQLEAVVFAIPVSFMLTTFILLIAAYAGIILTPSATWMIVLLLPILLLLTAHIRRSKEKSAHDEKWAIFSTSETSVILILLLLTFVIKVIFLSSTIFPTATDLGHHMFWVEKIVDIGTLPEYMKTEVVPAVAENPTSASAAFSGPHAIADFIIGEHIIFAAIALLTGMSTVSAFPSLVLFAVHMATILALFLFSLRLLKNLPYGKSAAIFTLLLIGPLWAVSGAQAKFVSGGVIGNILGNLLIVSTLYFLCRALLEKNAKHLLLALMLGVALLFTHHLSMFIFVYVIAFFVLVFVATNTTTIIGHVRSWLPLLSVPVVIFSLCAFLFTLFIHTPSYLNADAITSSVGAPSKATRVGLSVTDFISTVGAPRATFAFLGLLLILLSLKVFRELFKSHKFILPSRISSLTLSFLLAWFLALFLMSTAPEILRVNIITTRIVTYAAFPAALLGGFFLGWFFFALREKRKDFPVFVFPLAFTFIFLFMMVSGIRDSARALSSAPQMAAALETFHAAQYVDSVVPEGVWTLKDHNHIVSDTWMKVFLGGDYSNPLSRSFFARYESNPRREHCTLLMISEPTNPVARECYDDLKIGPVVVDTSEDAGQFVRNENFIKVYENTNSSIFWYAPTSSPPQIENRGMFVQ